MAIHQYDIDTDDGTDIVFRCPEPGCGRRIVLTRGRSRAIVIDRGDFFAEHTGAVGPIGLRVAGDSRG